MIKIKHAHLKRYKVAEFAAFCFSFKELVTQSGVKNLGLHEPTYNEFCSRLDQLSDAVNATQGSDKTPVIGQYNKERGRYFRYIRNVLANLRFSTDPTLAALSDTAKTKILKVYPAKIANEAGQQETAHVAGFVLDVRNFFADQLDKLGIKAALTALETANNNFQSTFLERSDELSSIDDGMTAKCRAQLEELFRQMEVTLNYNASLTYADDEKSVMLQAASANMISVLNQYIDELWQSIKQGKAQSKETPGNANSGGNSGGNANPGGGNSELPTLGA